MIKALFIFVTLTTATKSFCYETNPLIEQLKASISAHSNEVRICYNNLEKKLKGAQGKIVVEIEVNDQGKLTRSEINSKKTTLKNNDLFECIKQKTATWIFPSAPAKQVLSVSYPFIFKKH